MYVLYFFLVRLFVFLVLVIAFRPRLWSRPCIMFIFLSLSLPFPVQLSLPLSLCPTICNSPCPCLSSLNDYSVIVLVFPRAFVSVRVLVYLLWMITASLSFNRLCCSCFSVPVYLIRSMTASLSLSLILSCLCNCPSSSPYPLFLVFVLFVTVFLVILVYLLWTRWQCHCPCLSLL